MLREIIFTAVLKELHSQFEQQDLNLEKNLNELINIANKNMAK